jgi:hypothetical protein
MLLDIFGGRNPFSSSTYPQCDIVVTGYILCLFYEGTLSAPTQGVLQVPT